MATITQDTKFIDIFRSVFKDFHGARLKFLFLLIQAVSSAGTINLVKVAAALRTKVDASSNYRRIQRFIHNVRLPFHLLAPFLLRLVGLQAPYNLILDRTNWKFGKVEINFLMLSVCGSGWSIPLMWELLPKAGNSSEQERIQLFSQFLEIFGKRKIHNLTADREFIGNDWFDFLITCRIPFDIRLRENMLVLFKGRWRTVRSIFKNTPLYQIKTIDEPVLIGRNYVYLQGQCIINSKTHQKEFLIVATYIDPKNSIKRYAERWYIENMFKDLKSNGFQLECTHVTRPERLNTLMAVLAIAYAWMIRIGIWIRKIKPKLFKKKKHGRPGKSIFRAGLEAFANAIHTMDLVIIRMCFKFLSCT